jgi:hypothetical protein
MDWSGCSAVVRVPGKVSGQWIVKGNTYPGGWRARERGRRLHGRGVGRRDLRGPAGRPGARAPILREETACPASSLTKTPLTGSRVHSQVTRQRQLTSWGGPSWRTATCYVPRRRKASTPWSPATRTPGISRTWPPGNPARFTASRRISSSRKNLASTTSKGDPGRGYTDMH